MRGSWRRIAMTLFDEAIETSDDRNMKITGISFKFGKGPGSEPEKTKLTPVIGTSSEASNAGSPIRTEKVFHIKRCRVSYPFALCDRLGRGAADARGQRTLGLGLISFAPPGQMASFPVFPRLTPWAAFFRRFAAPCTEWFALHENVVRNGVWVGSLTRYA
jgi:hypothetical protein